MTSWIFDMDGVIFDSENLYLSCCEEEAERLGMENIEETVRRCIGVTTEVTEAILLETYQDAALVRRFRENTAALFRKKYQDGQLKIRTGVRELLQTLKDAGARMAIASSTQTEIVRSEIREAGLLDFFDVIVGGDQAPRSKPNPDIFLKAAERLEAKPEDCVVVEDSYHGIRAAKAAGMTAIMVPDLLAPNDEMRQLADDIAESLLVIAESMKKYCSGALRTDSA